jgi:thiamine biosynthesis lipoprotein
VKTLVPTTVTGVRNGGGTLGAARTNRDVIDGWAHGVSGSVVREDHVVHVEHIWGTVITIKIVGTQDRQDHAMAAVSACRELFAEVDQTFSTFKPTTEVTLYRAGLERPGGQSDEFEEVRHACLELRTLTHGAFDPWAVPGGYDPSGYVKGWAVGRTSLTLTGAGFTNHLVNAGGDLYAAGDEVPDSRQGWATGIVNPHASEQIIKVVNLRNQAMATSGHYERGHHVVDPSSGLPASSVDSATVVGPDPGQADALASAALVRGTESAAWFDLLGPEWSLYLVIGQVAHSYGPAFD